MGICRIERVLTGNAWRYRKSLAWRQALTDLGATLLHTYNHHRSHTALGGKPPITRVDNPAGQDN
jgi:hypothetical protein